MTEVCAMCGREILSAEVPVRWDGGPGDDYSFTMLEDERVVHWRCRNGVQLELWA